MASSTVIEKVEALVEPILEDLNMELVDLEYRREQRGWVLRLFIDQEGGVNLDDCANVSREVSAILDVDDVVPNAYHLEVSSPGLNRPLKKEKDFERFAGRLVKIKMSFPIDPDGRGLERKTFTGILKGLEEGKVLVEQDDKVGGTVALALTDIASAHLEFTF